MSRTHPCLSRARLAPAVALACLLGQGLASGQDLEPRRWAHLPVGTTISGAYYVYTEGDVGFDPLLEVTNAKLEAHTLLASFTHAFDLMGKTARLDVFLPYQEARWSGLLSGAPATRKREGFADPWVRMSVALAGAPALEGEEYMSFRANRPVHTVVGAAVAVMLPLGEYMPDKLLNLGQNRFVIRPQLGVVHSRGPWAFELTSSAYYFTDNDDFFGGKEREQDPLYALQSHAIRTFPNRSWASLSAGYSWGGASSVDDLDKDDERVALLSAISAGMPVSRGQALKLVYLRGDSLEDVGSDTHNLSLSWNIRL